MLYQQVRTRRDNAKQFENFSSDPIDNENHTAAIEKKVAVDIFGYISTLAQFDIQDTIDICCTTTCDIVF